MLIPACLKGLAAATANREHARFGATTGVRVERTADGTPRAVATDGHILLVAEWEEPDGDRLPKPVRESLPEPAPGFAQVVPSWLWRLACRQAEKTVAQLAILSEADPAKVRISTDDGDFEAPPEEGRFPASWADVLAGAQRGGRLDPADHVGKYVPIRLGVTQFRRLCESLEGFGLDVVELEIPVCVREDAEGRPVTPPPIRFTAHGGGKPVRMSGLCTVLSPAVAAGIGGTAATS